MTEAKIKFDNRPMEAGRTIEAGNGDTEEEVRSTPDVPAVNVDKQRLIIDGLKHSQEHGYDVGEHFAAVYAQETPDTDRGV